VRIARVERVADALFAVTVDLRVSSSDQPLARRRARLWLERTGGEAQPPAVPNGVSTPRPVVTPWGFADLY
jgi:hypothetical protein